MKVTTLVKKLFGEYALGNMMDTLDDEDTEIEYWSIDTEEDAAEPSYFIRVYADGMYKLSFINDGVILVTHNVQELKNKLKVLAAEVNK